MATYDSAKVNERQLAHLQEWVKQTDQSINSLATDFDADATEQALGFNYYEDPTSEFDATLQTQDLSDPSMEFLHSDAMGGIPWVNFLSSEPELDTNRIVGQKRGSESMVEDLGEEYSPPKRCRN
jgi:hypothetical protein